MGIIRSQDLIDISSMVTARSTASGYAASNVAVLNNLMKRHRADDLITNDWLYEINFGGDQSVDAVVLNRVNFDKCRILGHGSDISATISANGADNGDADFDSGSITIPKNKITGRYQAYIALTGFTNLDYMWVAVDNGASAVGDYTTKWECSTVVPVEVETEQDKDMSFGYTPSGKQFYKKRELSSGGIYITKLGSNIRWSGQLVFGNRQLSDRDELLEFSRYDQTEPMIFYENDSIEEDISNVYICHIDANYEGSIIEGNVVVGNLMRLEEYV